MENLNPINPKGPSLPGRIANKATAFGRSVSTGASNLAAKVKGTASNVSTARKDLFSRNAKVKPAKTSRKDILDAKLPNVDEALEKKNPKLYKKLSALNMARGQIKAAFEAYKLEDVKDAMRKAQTDFKSKSLFGKERVDAEMMSLLSSCFMEGFEACRERYTLSPQNMQDLLQMQSELQADGLLTLGQTPEYKSASKLIDSIAQNVKLLNDFNTKSHSNEDTIKIFQDLQKNCQDIRKHVDEQAKALEKAMTSQPMRATSKQAQLEAKAKLDQLKKDLTAMEAVVKGFENEKGTKWSTLSKSQLSEKMDLLRIAQRDIIKSTNAVVKAIEANTGNLQNAAVKNKVTSIIAAFTIIPGAVAAMVASLAGIACGAFATATGIGAFAGIPLLVGSSIGFAAASSTALLAFKQIKKDILGQGKMVNAYAQDHADLQNLEKLLEKSIEADPVLELLTSEGTSLADKLAGRNEPFAKRMNQDLQNTYNSDSQKSASTILRLHPSIIRAAVTHRDTSIADVNSIFLQLSPNERVTLLNDIKKETPKIYERTLQKLHPVALAGILDHYGTLEGDDAQALLTDILNSEKVNGKPTTDASLRMAFVFAAMEKIDARDGMIKNFEEAHKLKGFKGLKSRLNPLRPKLSIEATVKQLESGKYEENNDLTKYLSLQAKDPEALIANTSALIRELVLQRNDNALKGILKNLNDELAYLDGLDKANNKPRKFLADQLQGQIADKIESELGQTYQSDFQTLVNGFPRFFSKAVVQSKMQTGPMFISQTLPHLSSTRLAECAQGANVEAATAIVTQLAEALKSDDLDDNAIDNLRKAINAFDPSVVANGIDQAFKDITNNKTKNILLQNLAKVFNQARPDKAGEVLKALAGDIKDVKVQDESDPSFITMLSRALYAESPSKYWNIMSKAGLSNSDIKTAKRLLAEGFVGTLAAEGAAVLAVASLPLVFFGAVAGAGAAAVAIPTVAAGLSIRNSMAENKLVNAGKTTPKMFFEAFKAATTVQEKIALLEDPQYASIKGKIENRATKEIVKQMAAEVQRGGAFDDITPVQDYKNMETSWYMFGQDRKKERPAAFEATFNLILQSDSFDAFFNNNPDNRNDIKREAARIIANNLLDGKIPASPAGAAEPFVDDEESAVDLEAGFVIVNPEQTDLLDDVLAYMSEPVEPPSSDRDNREQTA